MASSIHVYCRVAEGKQKPSFAAYRCILLISVGYSCAGGATCVTPYAYIDSTRKAHLVEVEFQLELIGWPGHGPRVREYLLC